MTKQLKMLLLMGALTLIVAAALAWLTDTTLRLQRSESEARARTEQQEKIHLALWRMEAVVGRLIVDEASRPAEDYLKRDGGLAHNVPDKVWLHILVDEKGQLSSPQEEGFPELAKQRLERFRQLSDWSLVASLADTTEIPALQSISDTEFDRRAIFNQGNAYSYPDRSHPVRTALLVPIWLDQGNELVLARKLEIDGKRYTGIVWLDWRTIQRQFYEAVNDLLPGATLVATTSMGFWPRDMRLASLPVVLQPRAVRPTPQRTPLFSVLFGAWAAVLTALFAMGALAYGTLSLSERRAAFVSAVTHELRTPLTTFRMYAEMLANGMVNEEKQRREYHATLHREAERLSHLVDNVLAYARLEKRRAPHPSVSLTVSRLLAKHGARLEERALAGEMVLEIDRSPALSELAMRVDPAAVEQVLFNLVDNACKYGRDGLARTIKISAHRRRARVAITVEDDGKGIPPDIRARLFEPFSKSSEEAAATAPGVGLGLALSRQLARQLGGDLLYEPNARSGARFVLLLRLA